MPKKEFSRREFLTDAEIALTGFLVLPRGSPDLSRSFAPQKDTGDPPNFPLPDGRHFTETKGEAPYPYGYSMRGVMWNVFQQYGGVTSWGPPISRPYIDENGRLRQDAQRGTFELTFTGGEIQVGWRNILDDLAARKISLDGPPNFIPDSFDWSSDQGKSWGHSRLGGLSGTIEENHLKRVFPKVAELPQLEETYFRNPLWFDQNGLPMAVKSYEGGSLTVVRCQRSALQLWRDKTPWTSKPNEVVVALGGELAKKYGLTAKLKSQPQNPYLKEGTPEYAESEQERIADALGAVSNYRLRNGLGAVDSSPRLMDIAKRRVEEMVSTGRFSHYSEDGKVIYWKYFEAIEKPCGSLVYEIIARSLAPDQEAIVRVMNCFQGSEPHRKALLWPEAKFVGVGEKRSPDGFLYYAGLIANARYTDP